MCLSILKPQGQEGGRGSLLVSACFAQELARRTRISEWHFAEAEADRRQTNFV